MGRIVSGVRVSDSASFQIIPRLVGRLGSEVRVSVSSESCATRMFVCPVHRRRLRGGDGGDRPRSQNSAGRRGH